MLNSQTALGYIEAIEKNRAEAAKYESGILAKIRAEPDYESNGDKDILEAVRLRAEAREIESEADVLISAFDFTTTFDGESIPKDRSND